MKKVVITGDAAERFDAARQEAEKQPKTDVSEDVKDARSMTSEEPCDGGVRILIDLTKLDQFATEYAQDKYLPAQTTAAVIEGAIWVCKNLCLGSLSGLLTNDLTGEFQKKMQKAMAEVMANDKMIKFVSQWEKKHGKKKPAKLPEGEDYGIDGLYAAVDILEITLGKVEGYQTNDGILEHQCAISAVKKLYEESEQEPAKWSEEDVKMIEDAIYSINFESVAEGLRCRGIKHSCDMADTLTEKLHNWLKSLKDRVQPQPKQEWSEEDEREIEHCIDFLNHPDMIRTTPTVVKGCKNWLKSLKNRVRPQWKPSDEQMNTLNKVREILHYKELWNKTNTIIFSYESLIRDLEQLKAL